MPKAFLIDYDKCFGCHACEVACQMLNDLPVGQFGVKLTQVGPWEYGEKQWQYDFVPIFTAQCNHCAERVGMGKEPSCVQHCGAECLRFGEIDDLYGEMKNGSKQILQVI